MKNGLYAETRKILFGYVGFVCCWENGEKIWAKSCEILRESKFDANKDAIYEANYIKQINNI